MKIHFGDPKFDYRIREQRLRERTITKEELATYLKNLPDESGKAEEITVCEDAPSHGAGSSLEPTFSAGAEA